MADIIQLLPDHVANQIAAGEVVQRPASVVKELLENAIDAGATSIQLIVKDAGKTLIQIIDNGKGMSTTDARLCFERHATSKIQTADDLFNLQTKGFRGEALASIAAIAHVSLKTKMDADDLGTQIEIEGSQVQSQDAVVTPNGTSIAVKNLFYNIPARRNFLKSDAVELRHIIDEFHRVALVHCDISFTMHHNGSKSFNLPVSNFRQRIVNIFGAKTNEKLVPVSEDTEVLTIDGFVGKPEFAKRTRGEQYFFVNDRFIKSAYLNHAITSAFEGLLKDGTHASYFLKLTVDPKTIDINIHPTKTEIKFDDEHTLYAILRSAVKHSLGQFNIAPVLDFERDANLDTPYNYQNKNVSNPTVEVDRSFNPFKNESVNPVIPSGVKSTPSFKAKPTQDWEGLYVGLESKSNADAFSSVQFETETVNTPMFTSDSDIETKQTTYQLHNKYIVSTIKSGMVLIDQNRAHRRVLYEHLLQQMTTQEAVSQQLLFPLELHFSPEELSIIKSLQDDLQYTGFVFDTVTETAVVISGTPMNVAESEVSIVLEQLISDVQNDVPHANFSATDLLAKSMAKSLAIRTGQTLTAVEQEHLVNQLFACKAPDRTPEGKPTCVTMTMDDIERKFV